MAMTMYCWRCAQDLPMLDEAEWGLVEPLLINVVEEVIAYRREHGCSLQEARDKGGGAAALAKYAELTGFVETNVHALWHHRASIYGPPCVACGKPLRTPQARFCAACGHVR